MSDTTYTYAVAQIRALELSLLSAADIEQLVACKSQAQCLQLLAEKGWGGSEIPQEQAERQKAWQTVRELVKDDAAVLDVLSYPDLFHNLKAAVKQACTKAAVPEIYVADCAITGETMQQWLSEKDYDAFPENMRAAAREAFETLLHTGDGQLCDVIVDRAALVAIRQAGQVDGVLHRHDGLVGKALIGRLLLLVGVGVVVEDLLQLPQVVRRRHHVEKVPAGAQHPPELLQGQGRKAIQQQVY